MLGVPARPTQPGTRTLTVSHRLRTLAHFLAILVAFPCLAERTAAAAGFDRVQVNVADPQAAAAWYARHLNGKATTMDSAPAVAFGNITIVFAKGSEKIPESVGSGIDHLGFSYADLDGAMQRF